MVRTKSNKTEKVKVTTLTRTKKRQKDRVKYDPAVHPKQLESLRLLGLTLVDIAAIFKIKKDTLVGWRAEHPAMRAAWERGGTIADGEVVAAMHKRAVGFYARTEEIVYVKGKPQKVQLTKYYPPDVQAAKYFLKNRTRDTGHHWDDASQFNVDVNHRGGIEMITTLEMPLNDFSDAELEALEKVGISLQAANKQLIDPTTIDPEEVEEAQIVS